MSIPTESSSDISTGAGFLPSESLVLLTQNTLHEDLSEALDCMRVWSAWGVGTMGEGDFYKVTDDDERLRELVDGTLTTLSLPENLAQPDVARAALAMEIHTILGNALFCDVAEDDRSAAWEAKGIYDSNFHTFADDEDRMIQVVDALMSAVAPKLMAEIRQSSALGSGEPTGRSTRMRPRS